MKKNDVAMIILIAAISMGVAYFIAGAIPGLQDTTTTEKVKVMNPISPDVGQLDETVFSPEAINPTVRVVIGSEQVTSGQ